MRDDSVTVGMLKEAVRGLCLEKGWGEDGEQDPQHVAMAMSVEMGELLEHFLWLREDGVRRLRSGEDPDRCRRIAGEFADVMMYGLQLAYTLGIDISAEVERKIEIDRGRRDVSYEDKQRLRDRFEEEHRNRPGAR